MEGWGLAV